MLKLSQDDKRFIRNILLIILSAILLSAAFIWMIAIFDLRSPRHPEKPVFSNCPVDIRHEIDRLSVSGPSSNMRALIMNIDSPEVPEYLSSCYYYEIQSERYRTSRKIIEQYWNHILEFKIADVSGIKESSRLQRSYIFQTYFNMLADYKSPEAHKHLVELMKEASPNTSYLNPDFHCMPEDDVKFRNIVSRLLRTYGKTATGSRYRLMYNPSSVWAYLLMYSYVGTDGSRKFIMESLRSMSPETAYTPEILLNILSVKEIGELVKDPVLYDPALRALGIAGTDEALGYLMKARDSAKWSQATDALAFSGIFIDERILVETGNFEFADYVFLMRCIDENAAPANIPAERRAKILLDTYKRRKSLIKKPHLFSTPYMFNTYTYGSEMKVSPPVRNALAEIWKDDPQKNSYLIPLLVRHGDAEALKYFFDKSPSGVRISFRNIKAALNDKPSPEFMEVLTGNCSKLPLEVRPLVKAMLGDISELKSSPASHSGRYTAQIAYLAVFGDSSVHDKLMAEALVSSSVSNDFMSYMGSITTLSRDELKRLPKLSEGDVRNISGKLMEKHVFFYEFNYGGQSPLPAFLYWNGCYGELLNIAYDRTMPYDLRVDVVSHLAGVDNAEIVEKLAALAESAAREEETKYLRSTRIAFRCFSSMAETYAGIEDRSDPRCVRIRKAIASALSEGDMYLKPELSEMLKKNAYRICDSYMVETLSGAAEKEKNLLVRGNLLNAVRMMKNRMQHLEPSPSKTYP